MQALRLDPATGEHAPPLPAGRYDLGNLAPLPEAYLDRLAPILRNAADGQELVMALCGPPTPPAFLAGKKTDRGVTNVRNTKSPHWLRWLGPEFRCLMPLTRFAEPDH